MKLQMKKEMDMTHGPMLKKIAIVALPLAISGLLQLLFTAADLIVVGRFSETPEGSIAAVGSTSSLINLIINLALGLSVGANVVLSQALGANEAERANRALHTALLLALICGFSMGAIGFFGARTFLGWMNSPPEVIGKATTYLRIYFLGLPANLVYNFGSAALRAKGDTTRPMIYLAIAGVLNIGLNIVLVLIGWDVAGVAVATILSQYVSAALLVVTLFRETGVCKLSLKKLKLYGRELQEIVRVGVPSGLLSTCYSLSNVIIQSSINSFGEVLTSANSVAANIEGFVYTSMNAVSSTALTFAGQNFGAKRYSRIKKVMWECCLLVAAIWLTIGGAILLFAEPLSGLYNSNPEIIEGAIERMILIIPTYFLCTFNEVFVGGLRSMNRTISPVLISLFCTCIYRIIWVYTACRAIHEPWMLYLSYPISWVTNLALTFVLFVVVYRKVTRSAKEETQELLAEAAIETE